MKERGQWPHDAAGAHKHLDPLANLLGSEFPIDFEVDRDEPLFAEEKSMLSRVTLFTCGVTRQLF